MPISVYPPELLLVTVNSLFFSSDGSFLLVFVGWMFRSMFFLVGVASILDTGTVLSLGLGDIG